MAEKISGLTVLGTTVILLCIFIPASSYTICRIFGRTFGDSYSGWDLAALLVSITTLGAMLYIMVDVQRLYPRCGTDGGAPQKILCLTDRYDDTGSAIEVRRDQAAAWMRFDLLVDIGECVIVPSALGIAVILVFSRVMRSYQTRRIPKE